MSDVGQVGSQIQIPDNQMEVGAVTETPRPAPSAGVSPADSTSTTAVGNEGAASRLGEHQLAGRMQQSRLNASLQDRFQQGSDQFRNQQYGQARETFQTMLNDPATPASMRPSLNYNLGQANYRQGNYQEAAAHFQNVVNDPNSAPVDRENAQRQLDLTRQLSRGNEQFRTQEYGAARETFQGMLDNPATPASMRPGLNYNLGQANLRQGNLPAASANFRSVIADPQTHPSDRQNAQRQLDLTHQRMWDAGAECNRRGDHEGARRHFETLRNEPGISADTRRAVEQNLTVVGDRQQQAAVDRELQSIAGD